MSTQYLLDDSWIPCQHHRTWVDTLSHHRTGGDNAGLPNMTPRQNQRTRPNPSSTLNDDILSNTFAGPSNCGPDQMAAGYDMTTRCNVNIITDRDHSLHGRHKSGARSNPYPIADLNVLSMKANTMSYSGTVAYLNTTEAQKGSAEAACLPYR
jgi:hypothetical protein